MKINSIKATNFLSFGSEYPLFIDFNKLGRIVCIKGENKDHGEHSSNASGKTNIIQSIVYALYGSLIKNIGHTEAINRKAKDKLCVEIDFDIDGHNYRVIRKRGKENSLTVFKDGKEEKLGGIPATQKAIDDIIRLNYEAFINISCFGQHNQKTFLSATPAQKRQIAESLLSLDKYNKYYAVAKKKKADLLQKLEVASVLYEKSLQTVESSEKQFAMVVKQQEYWRVTQLNAMERIRTQIGQAKEEIAKNNPESADSYQMINVIEKDIEENILNKSNFQKAIIDAEKELSNIREKRQVWMLRSKELIYSTNKDKQEIEELINQSKNLLNSNGTKCKLCFGTINKENFVQVINSNETHIRGLLASVTGQEKELEDVKAKMAKADHVIVRFTTFIEETKMKEVKTNHKIRESETKRASLTANLHKNVNSMALIIEQKIVTLSEQLEQKQIDFEAGDPYIKILNELKEGLSEAKIKVKESHKEVDKLTKILPYYEFWIDGFGDHGIRSFVIDEIIPLLNSRVNFWLQFLIDNKIKITFDNQLSETIEQNPSDGETFVYNAMSGGEVQRIDLGISQGFANVSSLAANCCPSLLSLDEIGTNLDRPGIQSVYTMICELSRERQVLVTTHDPELLEMLSVHDSINVVKKDGISKIK